MVGAGTPAETSLPCRLSSAIRSQSMFGFSPRWPIREKEGLWVNYGLNRLENFPGRRQQGGKASEAEGDVVLPPLHRRTGWSRQPLGYLPERSSDAVFRCGLRMRSRDALCGCPPTSAASKGLNTLGTLSRSARNLQSFRSAGRPRAPPHRTHSIAPPL